MNDDYHISLINLHFLPKVPINQWELVEQLELTRPINILAKRTLASSENNMRNVSDWSYNQFWYRSEFIHNTNINLIKEKFSLMLSIIIEYKSAVNCCASALEHKIIVPLL